MEECTELNKEFEAVHREMKLSNIIVIVLKKPQIYRGQGLKPDLIIIKAFVPVQLLHSILLQVFSKLLCC